MIDFILNQNVFVYVITAMGICGIAARIIISGYLSGMVRATENMGNTRKKLLGEIRKRYEELVSLDVDIQDIHSFVGRYIGKMKLWKMKVAAWNNFAKNMIILAAGTGIVGGYATFRMTGEAYAGMDTALYGLGVCGVMVLVWNIWDCRDKLDNLVYGIENYLENSLANRLKKENMKQVAATMRSDIHVIDIDDSIKSSEENEDVKNVEYITKKSRREKKRSAAERERKISKEQIAACDALFDNLVNGMINP